MVIMENELNFCRVGLFLRDNGFQVYQYYHDAEEVLKYTHPCPPDIILMQIPLLPANGFRAWATIRKNFPKSKCIAMTEGFYLSIAKEMSKEGARAYFCTLFPGVAMLTIIRKVLNGEIIIPVNKEGCICSITSP